jgi:hypothetical protein
LRLDLKRAFGLEEWDTERLRYVPTPGREMTARERQLLEGDKRHLPVDFHSWRRAYNQSLAESGLNAQQAMALAGHSTLAAHERYLRSSATARQLPDGALPKVALEVAPRLLTVVGVPLDDGDPDDDPSGGPSGRPRESSPTGDTSETLRIQIGLNQATQAGSSAVEHWFYTGKKASPLSPSAPQDSPADSSASPSAPQDSPLAETIPGDVSNPGVSEGASEVRDNSPDDSGDDSKPRLIVEEGGLKDEPVRAPAGVEAVRRAMDAAMRSGDWKLVKDLAEAMEQLWAQKRSHA